MLNKKVAICGTSPTLCMAPFNDLSYDIWFLNHLFFLAPRITKHFDLHNTNYYNEDNKYYKFLKSMERDLYLTGVDKRFSNANIYPKDKIINKYGDFFTCSAAWMIALAIEQGYKTIALYGIDMSSNIERIDQKPSVLYMIGVAKGMGINIIYPPQCQLFYKDRLYWN